MALDDLTKEKNSIALTSLSTDNDLEKELDEVDFSMIIPEGMVYLKRFSECFVAGSVTGFAFGLLSLNFSFFTYGDKLKQKLDTEITKEFHTMADIAGYVGGTFFSAVPYAVFEIGLLNLAASFGILGVGAYFGQKAVTNYLGYKYYQNQIKKHNEYAKLTESLQLEDFSKE